MLLSCLPWVAGSAIIIMMNQFARGAYLAKLTLCATARVNEILFAQGAALGYINDTLSGLMRPYLGKCRQENNVVIF